MPQLDKGTGETKGGSSELRLQFEDAAQRLCIDLLAFFAERLKVHLRDKGARHDLIDAVFALGGQDDLALIVKRVEALTELLKTDDGANLLAGVKRAQNILAIEEKKDKTSYAGPYDQLLLKEPEEVALAARIESVKDDTAAAINVENFAGAMRALAELRAPVDAFFDKVTVNTEDAELRRNRPHLMSEIPPPPSTSPTSPKSPVRRPGAPNVVIHAQVGTQGTSKKGIDASRCATQPPSRLRMVGRVLVCAGMT